MARERVPPPWPTCDDCGERLVNLATYASCPKGHGPLKVRLDKRRLVPKDRVRRRLLHSIEKRIRGTCIVCNCVVMLMKPRKGMLFVRRHGPWNQPCPGSALRCKESPR